MEEGINLDPMRLISVQQRRIAALMNENVQLEAAVEMLQDQVAQLTPPPDIEDLYKMTHENTPFTKELMDVTDEVAGAEIGKAEITS